MRLVERDDTDASNRIGSPRVGRGLFLFDCLLEILESTRYTVACVVASCFSSRLGRQAFCFDSFLW